MTSNYGINPLDLHIFDVSRECHFRLPLFIEMILSEIEVGGKYLSAV